VRYDFFKATIVSRFLPFCCLHLIEHNLTLSGQQYHLYALKKEKNTHTSGCVVQTLVMLLNQRIDFVSRSRHLGTIGAVLCALVLLFILPATIQRRRLAAELRPSPSASSPIFSEDADVFSAVEKKQRELLHEVMALQDQVAKFTAQVKAWNESVSTRGTNARVTSSGESAEDRAFSVLAVRCGLEAFRADVSNTIAKVAQLGEKTKKSFAAALTANRQHYLVKWHGLHGVDTSDPLYTEVEAEMKFEKVGNFAKKLLRFQPGGGGGVWSVARAFGGENWLALMSNDGNIQKPPAAAAAADKSSKPAALQGHIPVV
jgi:hypothetical protein